jgi:hypothetical protein
VPFWQDLIGPMRYVLAFRNPGEVIASLQRRNAMNVEKAERLWLAHVHASLTHTSGQPRMFVFYDDIMNDYATELARMAAFLGHPDAAEDPAVGAAAADYLEETLCHHRTSMADLAGDCRVSFAVTGLYFAIRGHAPRPTSSENGDLHALATRAVEAWDQLSASTAERDALARANAHLSGTVAHLTESVASLTSERDAVFRMVDEIHASAGWTLVARVRGVIVRLFPAGSGRRRTLDVVLRRIAPERPSTPSQAAADSFTT